MKRIITLLFVLALSQGLFAREHEDGGGRQDGGGGGEQQHGGHAQESQGSSNAHAAAPAPAAPAQQRQQKTFSHAQRRQSPGSAAAAPQQHRQRINLGHTEAQRNFHQNQENRVNFSQPHQDSHPGNSGSAFQAENRQPHAGNVVHHSAYKQDEGRARLRALGVTSIPEHIANRAHILDTPRAHSVIAMPTHMGDGRAISHVQIRASQWNDPIVRTHMNIVVGDHLRVEAIARFNGTELLHNHYYWHHDEGGFDYCHYYDRWGFHWYGWYVGQRQFWTRYYSDRWWFYDDAFDRWCFWNGGSWWWQDPYHVGDLYLYDNDQYIPSNSDGAQEVSTIEPPDAKSFRSGDGTRMVKIMDDSRDAFLYDTAIPPSFNPLYLASKVESVKFADTSKGAPLQIMLKLSDGRTDLFDAQGIYIDFGDSSPGEAPAPGPGNADREPMQTAPPR